MSRSNIQIVSASFALLIYVSRTYGQEPPKYFHNYESGTCALPMQLTEHSPMDQPALRLIADVDGCLCRETPGVYVVCFGLDCNQFPSTVKVTTPLFKMKQSNMQMIRKDDLLPLTGIRSLEIESHLKLSEIQPGCFRRMSRLTSLTISGNFKLNHLHVDVFEGLVNLSLLDLRKNGFTSVIDATRALGVAYVPNLRRLELNENIFERIDYYDFYPMNGSGLQELNLYSCSIEFIHPACLVPLRRLKLLRLGRNVFSEENLTKFVETSVLLGVAPTVLLNLYDVGLRKAPYEMLSALGRSSILYVTLAYNNFDRLDDDSLPEMPHVIGLDLRGNLISSISAHAFAKQPRLIALLLACNKLYEMPAGALVPTLKELDFAGNTKDTDGSFCMEDYAFINMSRLVILQLSFNNIVSITEYTFAGLTNLATLNLKRCALYDVAAGAFEPLKSLLVLNLSSNPLLSFSLTADTFKGLDKLQILQLDDCDLQNITTKPSLFRYTPNLIQLTLTRNKLFIIASNQLIHLNHLRVINLADNKLLPWSESIFALGALSVIDMSNNKLTYVTRSMLADWSTADYLYLSDNPLFCDCSLHAMASWVSDNKSAAKYMLHRQLHGLCSGPNGWRRKPIWECLEDTTRTIKHCEYEPQSLIVTLFVLVFVLAALVALHYMCRWYLRYWIFLLRMKQQQRQARTRRKHHREDDPCRYDAFVSYCNEDREFVMRLVTMMEDFEPNLKLCIYERDFQIGADISQSILQSVSVSKRTLLVVSDAFAKSQWCRWETQLAEYHQLFFCNESRDGVDDTLLIIKLDKVSKLNMTPTLRYLMKTRIYLEWDTNPTKHEYFWGKLRHTLASPKGQEPTESL